MNRERNFVEIYGPNTGRAWTANAIDEFVVGKLHGGYDMNTILRYIRYTYVGLTSMTIDELQAFWDSTLATSTNRNVYVWTILEREHPEVQKVLRRISTLLAEANCVID